MKFQATLPSAWFRRAPRADRPASGLRDFFRYHGALAPGVRLLRTLPFGAKAAVVSGAFLLPLGLMCVDYVERTMEKSRQIDHAQSALMYSTRIHQLVSDVQVLRRSRFYAHRGLTPPSVAAIPSVTEAWQQVEVGLQALLAVDAARLKLLPTSSRSLEKSRQCVSDLKQPSGVESALTWETACIDVLRDLQAQVVQHSPLSAIGGPTLLHLQSLVLQDLPDIAEYLVTLRGPATAVLQHKDEQIYGRLLVSRSVLLGSVVHHASDWLESHGDDPVVQPSRERVLPLLKDIQTMLSTAGLVEAAADRVPDPSGITEAVNRLLPALLELRQLGVNDLQAHLDAAEKELARERLWTGISVIALVVLAVYLLMAFYRVMHGGLNQVRSQVARMASGDLSARPQPWGNDEVAQALSSLGASLARLADLFAAVRQGVSAVSHASRDIASGNHDLSQRTDRAAQGIQEILHGVTGYTAQLDECGHQIDRAVEVVESMRLDAARSRTRMSRLDERMQSLQGKSREIGEISELIDNIAFRTNILALNASVEAAKAGEAGRGFAVVAQEVRSLAQRSAESARRIADIIQRSTDDIEQGSALSQLASQSLADTDGHVQRIHETMQQIVSLTREGQSSSQHILDEIRGLSEVTQENTRLVGQMEAASHALSTQGDHLSDKVASFKLN